MPLTLSIDFTFHRFSLTSNVAFRNRSIEFLLNFLGSCRSFPVLGRCARMARTILHGLPSSNFLYECKFTKIF